MIQNLTMEGLNHTTVVSVFTGTSSELSNAIGPFLHDLFANHLTELASRMFTFSIIWKVLVIFLILSNVKSLPLIWHLRIINAFRFCLRSQRSVVPLTSKSIFHPLITTTSPAPLLETDFINCHKSNSTYFSDVDVARTHLLCTLFSIGIESLRGGTSAISALKSTKPDGTKKEGIFGIALGGVQATFRRELMPYQGYEMWTRILAWDEKWFYVVTHFVEKDASMPRKYTLYPQQETKEARETWASRDSSRRSSAASNISDEINAAEDEKAATQPKVYATVLSKCVCKQGRKTLKPDAMLKLSKLLPEMDEEILDAQDTFVSQLGSIMENNKASLNRVEEERVRGMQIVGQMLSGGGQADLEGEFDGNAEVLGRHTDGSGIVGVVTTLASLGGLWKGQVL